MCCCSQGTSGPDPTTVYVDMRALRHDRYGFSLLSSFPPLWVTQQICVLVNQEVKVAMFTCLNHHYMEKVCG